MVLLAAAGLKPYSLDSLNFKSHLFAKKKKIILKDLKAILQKKPLHTYFFFFFNHRAKHIFLFTELED